MVAQMLGPGHHFYYTWTFIKDTLTEIVLVTFPVNSLVQDAEYTRTLFIYIYRTVYTYKISNSYCISIQSEISVLRKDNTIIYCIYLFIHLFNESGAVHSKQHKTKCFSSI